MTVATKKNCRTEVTGKSFGAFKSAVIRVLKKGYHPEWTQITVTMADRERLREYCQKSGSPSIVEGFHLLLNEAGMDEVDFRERKGGRLENVISSLKIKANEYDGLALADRVRSGEFDEWLKRTI